MIFDVYLGELRGLTHAKIEFDTSSAMLDHEPAPFMKIEVTEEEFFEPRILADSHSQTSRRRSRRLSAATPPPIPDE